MASPDRQTAALQVALSLSRSIAERIEPVRRNQQVPLEQMWDACERVDVLIIKLEKALAQAIPGTTLTAEAPKAESVSPDSQKNPYLTDSVLAGFTSSRVTRKILNKLVGESKVTREQLVTLAKDKGWQVTKEKPNSVSFRHSDGKLVRVGFGDIDTWLESDARRQLRASRKIQITGGRWIYGLLAFAQDGSKACYVGQTASLNKRVRYHANNHSENSSYHLKKWAREHGCEVQIVLLAHADIDESSAAILEGYWLQLATQADFRTPGVSQWGNLPKTEHYPSMPAIWPEAHVIAAQMPLSLATAQEKDDYLEWSTQALFHLDKPADAPGKHRQINLL